MKHKKQDLHAEDEEHTDAAATEQAGIPDAGGPDDVEVLRSRLSEAEARAAEHLDGWQRALADFQNYRKRVERDRDAERVAMKGDLIRSVLPVLDDLERALQNRPEDDAWSNGIELIQRKLLGLLEAEGVKRIEAEGAVFDPSFHEAIAQETAADLESGRVVAVMQQGYVLGDRVIRPAQVRVAV